MSILIKLNGVLSPKDRTIKVNEELNVILGKYNCILEVGHRITIVPLEMKKTEKEQEQENYNKA